MIASGFSDLGYDVDVGPLFSTPAGNLSIFDLTSITFTFSVLLLIPISCLFFIL